jgi:hypothetical protein
MHRDETQTGASADDDSEGEAQPTEKIRLSLIRAAKVQELEERAKEMSERLGKLVAERLGKTRE